MTAPTLGVASTPDGLVAIGGAEAGLWIVDPITAREVARQILVAASQALGEEPAHIYQVDNR
jgi:hypothetical protein